MDDLIDFAQQVKRANDIVDVVGSYIELRKQGTNYFARCPFHGEKTASFSVNRNRQIFKCFGCGESGDVIKFVQKYESCSFFEAVEILAKRAGLKMPETAEQKRDKNFEQKKKKRDLYLEICKQTAIFYYKTFYSSVGKVARDYMEKRGYTPETVKKFGIGYSPDMYSLVNFLHAKGFADEDCLACGVVQRAQDGSLFDAMFSRLIVPIYNISGKVIAFGGRVISAEKPQFAKYKNTSETLLFSKKDTLFSLNLAKQHKQQTGTLGKKSDEQPSTSNFVMVEGYMDVIAMYQAGYRCTVASMGTSLTENQARLLSRLTDSVYICYDGDSAGQGATIRGLDILDKAGMDVKVMSIPDNLDPDEYLKLHGMEAFDKLMDEALPLPDFKLHILEKAFPIANVDSAKRNDALPKYIRGAVKMLRQLDDVRQAQYMSVVSLKTGYSQEYLRRKINSTDETVSEADEQHADSPTMAAKYFVAACLVTNQEFAILADKPFCPTVFLSQLYDYIFDCKANGQIPQLDMIYTVCPNASQEEYSKVVDVDFSPARYEKNKQYFDECKRTIAVEALRTQRDALLRELKANPQNSAELLGQIAELNRKMNNPR